MLQVRELTPTIGAVVEGVDLSQDLDDELIVDKGELTVPEMRPVEKR